MTATLVDSGQLRPIPIHNRMEPCPFPIDPVFEIVAPWRNGETPYGINERRQGERVAVALCLGISTRRVTRWDSRGLDAYEADEVAASLSLHPVSIWPDWFEHAPDYQEAAANESTTVPLTRCHRQVSSATSPPAGSASLADLFERVMAEWKSARVAS